MANNVFFFYYVPTWDWPPEGPIKLGNVLSSIKKADQPLFTAPLPADSEVYSTEKFEVKYSREKAREGQFSILTKPLSVLGLGVDVGTELKKRYVFGIFASLSNRPGKLPRKTPRVRVSCC